MNAPDLEKLRRKGILLLCLALLPLSAYGQVTVSNVRAAQRAGTNLVDIDYDITGTAKPSLVTLQVSDDDGNTFAVPATSLSGAVGYNISPAANLRITWDAGTDWGAHFSDKARFKVTADDTPVPDGFALIPAGSFQMGDSLGDGYSWELPIHTVQVSAFYMAKNLATWAMWSDVRTWGLAHGYTDISAGAGKAATHPVQSITWYDMVKWCNARSEREGLVPCYTLSGAVYRTTNDNAVVCNWSANGYRLPTEAEWEKAARGGLSGKRFPWGDTISQSQANYMVYSGNGTTNFYSYDVTPMPSYSATYYYHPTYNVGVYPYTSPVGSLSLIHI